MVMQVLDSTDLKGILAHAGVEVGKKDENTEANAGQGKPEADAKAIQSDKQAVEKIAQDDEEDENGLTAAEREGLTAKMLKAIGKKHRMVKEAEEFAASQYSERKLAEQRAADLERQLAELRKSSEPEKQEKPNEKPMRHNFATDQEYIEAMVAHGVEEALRKSREEAAAREALAAQERLVESAKSRIAKAMEIVPDFAEVTGSVDAEVPAAIANYMQKSEMFAELGYHLAKNPDLLVSISKLAPDEQLVTIGKIESTLKPFGSKTQDDFKSSAANLNGKPSQGAPSKDDITSSTARSNSAPVITPLSSSGSAVEKDPAEMNIREVIADYAKKNGTNFNLRKRH